MDPLSFEGVKILELVPSCTEVWNQILLRGTDRYYSISFLYRFGSGWDPTLSWAKLDKMIQHLEKNQGVDMILIPWDNTKQIIVIGSIIILIIWWLKAAQQLHVQFFLSFEVFPMIYWILKFMWNSSLFYPTLIHS